MEFPLRGVNQISKFFQVVDKIIFLNQLEEGHSIFQQFGAAVFEIF